ncbi:cobalamin biosynthesis protein CobD/CbiB [Thalassomonas haliotis]|uniref:Cobalamin biosynthesis protein n=1 Tax=Thalassomonas haliotis TaxID=485448 RepID=A0ABY7VFR5_9GAMM|nr:cobalamin biosynthesis protein [Thalassomonas haliotis]WDE12451.1 cobalamin biosynthesis protein [Thalassomonas haliotis]
MMNFPEITGFSFSVLLLFSVLLVKFIVTRFSDPRPLHYFRFYCQRLADKVNKSSNSENQQNIAGLVAIIVTLVPLLVILWLFEAFIEVPWLWQGLLLYLALGSLSQGETSLSLAKALSAQQKYLARETLTPWLLRDTQELSPMGLSKASIEAQLLHHCALLFTVSFYFLIGGGLAAIGYRLLLEMHFSWNIKRQRFRHFGRQANQLVKILQWLPARLLVLLLLIFCSGKNPVLFTRLLRGHFFRLSNDILIYCFALVLGIKLGGVASYDQQKLRRPAFNDLGRQPEPADIIHAGKRIKQLSIICSFLLLFTVVLLLAIAKL